MTFIVFSRDRAMQLDAFLRSYEKFVTPRLHVAVIPFATTHRHFATYRTVFERCGVNDYWQEENRFKESLLYVLPRYGNVTFFVDDQIFVRPWSVVEEPGLSLRLGLNITSNYSTGVTDAPLPPQRLTDGNFVFWRWRDGEHSWSYPLSLDGHVFDAAELRPMIEGLAFTSPNTLEAALQTYLPAFLGRRGSCYPHSKIVNVPWNRVQTDYENRSAGGSVETMLAAWEAGKQIDVSGIYSARIHDVHQEFPLVFEDRG